MLAGTRERLDWLKMAKARGRYLNMDLEIISVDEAAKLFPLLDKKHFAGAMYDPIEGHVDPYGVTHAYAKSAQIGGAEIVRHTRVTRSQAALGRLLGRHHRSRQRAGRTCRECRGPVGARGGPHGRHRAAHAGDGASVSDHRRHARVAGQEPEQLHAIDFEGEIYLRQERGGMLMGTYERAGVPWSPVTTPWDFGQDLVANDLERIAPSLAVGFEHFPALGTRGHQKSGERPVHFRAGRQPPVGPVRGLRISGSPAASWRGSARAAASALRCRTGWSTATPAPTSGAWTWRDTATGPPSRTPMQSARELFAPLPHPFPERGTAGGASPAHHADLRKTAGRACGIRRLLRARASPVVRAERRGGHDRGELPPLECAPARRQGVPRGARCRGLLEISNYGKFEVFEVRAPPSGCRTSWPTACRTSAASR
jgi:glycine/D-amino acid oxidase-like deaminating enzyme